MKKLGEDYEIIDDSKVKPRSQFDLILEQEPTSAFGVRRSFEQLNLTSHADSFYENESTCFDLNDDLKIFADG